MYYKPKIQNNADTIGEILQYWPCTRQFNNSSNYTNLKIHKTGIKSNLGFPANSFPSYALQKVAKTHGCNIALTQFCEYRKMSTSFQKTGVKSYV